MNDPDHTQSTIVSARLQSATKRLHDMANDVGGAKQVIEFISDMKKGLLSKYMKDQVMADIPVSKAETVARANPEFIEGLQKLSEQYLEAQRILARWTAEQASYEAARSLLSFSREALRNLEG